MEIQNTKRVLVLIPAFNESQHIAAVVRGANKFSAVLVIDDGSTDETTLQAASAGAEVFCQKNLGKGAALQAGFKRALEKGYDAVLTLDGDGQHDPQEIPAFLEKFEESQADLIIGRRDFTVMPPVRRLSNTLGTLVFSLAARKPIPDNQSGYRLISRRLMEEMLSPSERGFEFEVEMIIKCIQRDYQLEWVPIRTIYADEKSHIKPFKHVMKFLQVSLRGWSVLRQARKKGLYGQSYS